MKALTLREQGGGVYPHALLPQGKDSSGTRELKAPLQGPLDDSALPHGRARDRRVGLRRRQHLLRVLVATAAPWGKESGGGGRQKSSGLPRMARRRHRPSPPASHRAGRRSGRRLRFGREKGEVKNELGFQVEAGRRRFLFHRDRRRAVGFDPTVDSTRRLAGCFQPRSSGALGRFGGPVFGFRAVGPGRRA